jgi:urease beta subunit
MATRSATPIAYRLLRGLAMRQQVTCSALPSVYHVAGINNVLANAVSRPAHGVASHFHLMETSPQNNVSRNISHHFQLCLSSTTEVALAQGPAEFWPMVQLDCNTAWATI